RGFPAARSRARSAFARAFGWVGSPCADGSFRVRSREDAEADGRVEVEHAPPMPDQRVAVEANNLVVISPSFQILDGTRLTGVEPAAHRLPHPTGRGEDLLFEFQHGFTAEVEFVYRIVDLIGDLPLQGGHLDAGLVRVDLGPLD